ncbi:MAG: hypothetical protein V7697_24980 [Rhodococcus erythropolis]
MSGYQSLHDLIANKVRDAGSLTVADVDSLTDKIYTEWLPDEVAAVNKCAEEAKKQLNKAASDNQQLAMTANTSNISQRDFSKLVGEF